MALIQVNYVSAALLRTVPVNVILPLDKITGDGKLMPRRRNPLKTLYLLHGVHGNYTDWVSGTRIQRWAEEKDLCVVMPSGDNAFYLDHVKGHQLYSRFLLELVEMTRRMFPLSELREDTFIAGLSMGGYGALRNALYFNETFGYAAGLSSALHLDTLKDCTNDEKIVIFRRDFVEGCYGEDLDQVMNDDRNPEWLARKRKSEGSKLPAFYLCCGTEDGLMEGNIRFRNVLQELGAQVTWHEGPGGHEWDYWDREIKNILEWLPLGDEHDAGMTSGNVGI